MAKQIDSDGLPEESLQKLDDVYDDTDEVELTPAEERRLLRKVDWVIVPYASLLYLISFLDRSNIGQAKLSV